MKPTGIITAVAPDQWFSSDAEKLIGLRVVRHEESGIGDGSFFTLNLDEIRAKDLTFEALEDLVNTAKNNGRKETSEFYYHSDGITVEEPSLLTLDSFLALLERPLTTEE